MAVYWRREIDYVEYDSACSSRITRVSEVSPSCIKRAGSFTITPFQLALATAKALITKSGSYSKEIMTLAKSYLVQFPILLDEDDHHNLRLNYTHRKLFRDFSKSSRIGELAQGIHYIFADRILNCSAVFDFEAYLEDIYPRFKHKGRKPDYVMVHRDKRLGILESKGSTYGPGEIMIHGLKQCADGRKTVDRYSVVKVNRAYSAAVYFALNGPRTTRRTTIHYIDPEAQGARLDDETYRQCLLKEYAKWFLIAGLDDTAKHLSKGRPVKQDALFHADEQSYQPANFFHTLKQQYQFLDHQIPLNTQTLDYYGDSYEVTYGISRSLSQFLRGEEQLWEESQVIHTGDGPGYVYESYSDGTWILVSGENLIVESDEDDDYQ